MKSGFSASKLPLLYRIHDKPDNFKMTQFVNLLESFGFNQEGGCLKQGLFERCTQNGDKNLLKGKHKASASGARGPEVGGSQDHSS